MNGMSGPRFRRKGRFLMHVLYSIGAQMADMNSLIFQVYIML